MEGNAMVGLGDAMLLAQRNGSYGGDMNAMWNNPFFYLIFYGLFANGGFGGYGGGGSALTRAELQMGLDNQDVKAGIRGIQQGLCDGFYANNTTLLQGFSGIQNGLAQLGYANQQCCCEIKNALHAEGEATRALITENIIQNLRDRIVGKDQELQTANFQLSQQAQTAAIVGALRPVPIPAYLTCSPYTAGVCAN